VVETVTASGRSCRALPRAVPAGVELKLVGDRTAMIRASISEVQFTLVLSGALVVGVVALFLRTARATLIAAVTLPLSVVAPSRSCGSSGSASTTCPHGAHDRHGLRGRRRHRDDRECRAPH
jgi:hypothetical protein